MEENNNGNDTNVGSIKNSIEPQFTEEQIEYVRKILEEELSKLIGHYQELQDNYIKKYDEINEGLQAMINVLQELLERKE